MRVRLLLLATALVAMAASAHADGIVITQTAKPTIRVYPGRSIDILGIKLGMSPEQVIEIVRKEYGVEPDIQKETSQLNYKGTQIETAEYIKGFRAIKNNGSDVIYGNFAYPSSGNGVVGVKRQLSFYQVQTAPEMNAMFEQLTFKYGQTSVPRENRGAPTVHSYYLNWQLGTTGTVACKNNKECEKPYVELRTDTTDLVRSIAVGSFINMEAVVLQSKEDPSRVDQIDITIEDVENKLLSVRQLTAQLSAAAEAAYRKQAVPSSAPKL